MSRHPFNTTSNPDFNRAQTATTSPVATDLATIDAYLRVVGAARELLRVLPEFQAESNVNAWVYTLAQALKALDAR